MGAVYALGHIGGEEAIEGLMKALKDQDGYIFQYLMNYFY